VKKGSTTHFTTVDAIQAAVYTDGSVSASFNVYDSFLLRVWHVALFCACIMLRRVPSADCHARRSYSDFMNYFSGVYIPDTTSGLLGGHCVRIVGWGEDAGPVALLL
jgi:hypothetical protein